MNSTEYGRYTLRANFDRTRLRVLLASFTASVCRTGEGSRKTDDRKLAFELQEQLLSDERPRISRKTFLRLAKW